MLPEVVAVDHGHHLRIDLAPVFMPHALGPVVRLSRTLFRLC